MIELRDWLEAQGLGQYSRIFADNDIDFDVLVDLTDGDLEKLGLSLGHRRKLLRALAAHKQESGRRRRAPPESATDTPETHDAERRQVTVMFCDLVGSTELANLLDPRTSARSSVTLSGCLRRRHHRFDGFVASSWAIGACLSAIHAGQRGCGGTAVRSALAIIDAISQLRRPDGRAFQARIGIATGIVVIGDIVGEEPRANTDRRETPNPASRLQAMADPNSILVGENTSRLFARRFEYQSLWRSCTKVRDSCSRLARAVRGQPARAALLPRTPSGTAHSSAAVKRQPCSSIGGASRRKAMARRCSFRVRPAWASRASSTPCPSASLMSLAPE
jgi:class 3 adenylate cyclase